MLEKLFSLIASIPGDKKDHFTGGMLLAMVVMNILVAMQLSWVWASVGSVVFVCIVGYLKEMWDSEHSDNHTEDVKDFFATSVGGIVSTLFMSVLLIIKTYFN